MDDDDNNNEQRQQEEPYELLSMEGQKVMSIINIKSELPPEFESAINEVLNDAADGLLFRIRNSLQDLIYNYKEDEEGEKVVRDTLLTTIEEKQFETAIRFFPDILSDKMLYRGYQHYPIEWMALPIYGKYDLRNASLIPLMVELGIELRQFDEELRGGLLSTHLRGCRCGCPNVLQRIVCYDLKENENNQLLDECFLTVWNRLKENNHFIKEDLRQHNLLGRLIFSSKHAGRCFSEARFRYIVDWDPMTLTIPAKPERGNWLPIHLSASISCDDANDDIQEFKSILQAGLQYFPEKLGFVFCEATQPFPALNEDIDIDDEQADIDCTRTAFQSACKSYGRDAVTKEVIDCMMDHCATTATNKSTTTPTTESDLLLPAVTDESIYLDGLYTLIRKDPTAALLRLQQKLLREEQTDNNNNGGSSNNNNNTAATVFKLTSTTSSSSLSSLYTISSQNNNNNNKNYNYNDTQSSSSNKQKKRKHGIEDFDDNNNNNNNINRIKHTKK